MFEIMIKFIDGETMILNDVTDYGLTDKGAYYVKKNYYKIFFNHEYVKYIGRSFDLNNCEVG